MVFSSSFIYAHERTGDGFFFIKRQLMFAVLGAALFYLASRMDYRLWLRFSKLGLWMSLLLLILVSIPGLGSRSGGAQRWLNLGLLTFQPAELAKFFIILFFSAAAARGVPLGRRLLLVFPSMALLLAQPDFGTVIILSLVLLSLSFLTGVRARIVIAGALAIAVGAAILIMRSPYRMARLATYLNPWEDPAGRGFQLLQSLLGVFNGEWLGVGLGNGKQKLFYLPEAHNDFIFSVVGEELGFAGISIVIIAFCFLGLLGISNAMKTMQRSSDTTNNFGLYLGTGITLLLVLQAFINMAVVLGLLPTKGLTLPFVSYGGSALTVNMFMAGILVSLGSRALPSKPPPRVFS